MVSLSSFSQAKRIIKKHEIRDGISPKSVVTNGQGLFAAQNMMYRHTITVYDVYGNRKAKIRDEVNLREFGYSEYPNKKFKGGPVEGAFTNDGKYLWVSNYNMEGEGFENPGCDACNGSEFDPSFLYKIDMGTFEIASVVKVGSVPKFLAISNDDKKLVVSNWSSGDVSIVDLEKEEEVKRIKVGIHPRGVDITEDSKTAYVTVMGSTKIAEIDLENYRLNYIEDVGRAPRSLILGNHDSIMYISLNSGGSVIKYNRYTEEKITCKTGGGPRSMCMTPEGDYLYVVNYFARSFSKINTKNMELVEEVKTADKPIGICGNWDDSEIWVACYSGRIEIFKDFHLDSLRHGNSMLGIDLSSFWAFNKSASTTREVEDTEDTEFAPDGSNNENEILLSDSLETTENIVNEPVMSVVSAKKPLTPINKDRFSKKSVISPDCTYHVIAGSFSVPENAQTRATELMSKGYSTTIIQGNLSYVSACCFSNRKEAEQGAKDVKLNTGYSAWILKR